MPVTELDFAVLDAAPERYAAAPTLLVRVRLTESTGAIVHAVALRAQVQIEPQRRQYAEREQEEVAAAKYLHALDDGEVPLRLLFSGTVFTRGETGFAVEQVPWHQEAVHRLPVRVWRAVMDAHFPGGGWIRLDRDSLDALARYRSARGLVSWEATLAELLPTEVPR